MVDALYVRYTFLVEFPRSIILCSPWWSPYWSIKTRWSHNASSLKQMSWDWFGFELPTNWWSLDFLGPHKNWRQLFVTLDLHLEDFPVTIIFPCNKTTTFVILGIHSIWHVHDTFNHFSNFIFLPRNYFAGHLGKPFDMGFLPCKQRPHFCRMRGHHLTCSRGEKTLSTN